jgi:hypothetical protein
MMRHLHLTFALMAAVAVFACAPMDQTFNAPEPQGEEVTRWAHSAPGGNPIHIYMRNNTERALVLTEFELYNCVNILNSCRRTYPNTVLPPGEIVRVQTIHKRDARERHRYSYRHLWATQRADQ